MSAPQNAFQHQMRLTNSPNVEQHHIVPPLPLLAVEQIWSVPTHPRANHLALQNIPVLAMPELVNATDQCVFQNAFGRLDAVSSCVSLRRPLTLPADTEGPVSHHHDVNQAQEQVWSVRVEQQYSPAILTPHQG